MIRLRSPRSFRSIGFSHTDKCMVGLKKNTLSSPVHTTHLQKRKRETQSNRMWLKNPDEEKQSQQHQSDPERGFLVTTKTRWSEFDLLILMHFCLHLVFFRNQSSAGSQDCQMDKSTICPASSICKPIKHLSFMSQIQMRPISQMFRTRYSYLTVII